MKVYEDSSVICYLNQRNLQTQYLKAKNLLESDYFSSINFKKRKPKNSDVFSFRVSKKYRAYRVVRENNLYVFEINNHQ